MTERPSLRDSLAGLAAATQIVDLSDRVAARANRLRRQRAGAAALATVAVIAAGGFAWSRAPLTAGPVEQHPGGAVTAPTPGTLVTCCGHRIIVPADPSLVLGSSLASLAATAPAATSAAPVVPATAGATARPPSATPSETPTAGHGCSSPWTDESSGTGSPFASAAQREKAATMGTGLCGYVGKAKVDLLVEWISMGGLNHVGEGVTYDIQASGPRGSVYLEIFHRPETSTATKPVVTTESGALRAQWPDGTVVLMTKGEDTALDRQIVTDPVFDAFR